MPAGTLPKTPDERLAVTLKLGPPELPAGVTITGVETTIEPPTDLEKDGNPQISTDGKKVSQLIKGGKKNVDYLLYFKVTNSQGHILNYPDYYAVLIQVR
jgi:hypothetical protein